mmetsp:Transcript_52649/g.157720  ORF Transcript_52649/g.157720 Transcript_52649/m.157720 type:complete len:290 (+) Transcript_52649:251-1120(+)
MVLGKQQKRDQKVRNNHPGISQDLLQRHHGVDTDHGTRIWTAPQTPVLCLPCLLLSREPNPLRAARHRGESLPLVAAQGAGRLVEARGVAPRGQFLHLIGMEEHLPFSLRIYVRGDAVHLEVHGQFGTHEFIVVVPDNIGLSAVIVLRLREHFGHPHRDHLLFGQPVDEIRLTVAGIQEHGRPRHAPSQPLRQPSRVRVVVVPTILGPIVISIVRRLVVVVVVFFPSRHQGDAAQPYASVRAVTPDRLHSLGADPTGLFAPLPIHPRPSYLLLELRFQLLQLLLARRRR